MTAPPVVKPPAAPRPRRTRIPIDWRARHGMVWGALNAGLAPLTIGLVVAAIERQTGAVIPAYLPVIGAILGAFATILVTLVHDSDAGLEPDPGLLTYRCLTWFGSGAWLAWAFATAPWRVPQMATLVIGAVTLASLAPLAKRRRRRQADALLRGAAKRNPLEQIRAAWEARLLRITRLRCDVVGVEMWPSGTGYTLDVDPPGGKTWRDMQQYQDELASDCRLPHGCGIAVGVGHDRRAVQLRVTTQSITTPAAEPLDFAPLSILDGLLIGYQRDGQPLTADIRQASWLLGAMKRKGKTTLLHRLISRLVRCTDAAVWVIDFNAGGLGRPWATPFVEGRAARPAVDWVAGTPEEAVLMARAAVAVALDRKRRGYDLKRLHNTTLMPVGTGAGPSDGPPEVVVVGDECSEFMGSSSPYRGARDAIEQCVRIAGDAAVNFVLSVLEGTSESVARAVKAQFANRLALTMSDEAEVSYILDYSHRGAKAVNLEDLPGPGHGWARVDGADTPVLFAVPDIRPDQIDETAVRTAGLRPGLTAEDISAVDRALGPGVYAARWTRTIRDVFGEGTTMTGPKDQDQGWSGPVNEDAVLAELAASGQELADAVADLHAGSGPAVPTDGELEALTETTSGPDRMVEIIRHAEAGLPAAEILERLQSEGYDVSRATLYRWLTEAVACSQLVKRGPCYLHISA